MVIIPFSIFGSSVTKFGVPARVEGPHRFLDQRVARVHREVTGRGIDDRAGAVMRCDRRMPGLRHAGDLSRLRQAAAPGQVQHPDAGGAGFEVLPEGVRIGQRLGGADPGLRVPRIFAEVVRCYRGGTDPRANRCRTRPERSASFLAMGKLRSEWNSTMMSILSPTALRIFAERLQRGVRAPAGEMSQPGGAFRRRYRTARSSCP